MIREYEQAYQCRLVVLIDSLFPASVTAFEETLYDANPEEDLHVMLATPGGDGETALRLVRQAQSRCAALTAVVPDQAKSAGTLFVLGADHIYPWGQPAISDQWIRSFGFPMDSWQRRRPSSRQWRRQNNAFRNIRRRTHYMRRC